MRPDTRRRASLVDARPLHVISCDSFIRVTRTPAPDEPAAAAPAAPAGATAAKPAPPAAARPRSGSAPRRPPLRRVPTPWPRDAAAAAREFRTRSHSPARPARPARRGARMAFVPLRASSFVSGGSFSFTERAGKPGLVSACQGEPVVLRAAAAAVAAAAAAEAAAEAAAAGHPGAAARGAAAGAAPQQRAALSVEAAPAAAAAAGAVAQAPAKQRRLSSGGQGLGSKLLSVLAMALAPCVVPMGPVGSSSMHDAAWVTLPTPLLPAGLYPH